MYSILYPLNGFHAEYIAEEKDGGLVETVFICQEPAYITFIFVDGYLTVFIKNGQMQQSEQALGQVKNKAYRHLETARKEAKSLALSR